MKRYVNGEEVELVKDAAHVHRLVDRLVVRSEHGTSTALAVREGDSTWVSFRGAQYRVTTKVNRARGHGQASSGEMRAPMPGQIVDVRHQQGETVAKGTTILVLEAMKTQQPFIAPFDGVIERLDVAVGAQVTEGQVLVRIVEAE